MVLIAGAGAAFHFGLFNQLTANNNWAKGYSSNFVSNGGDGTSNFASTSSYPQAHPGTSPTELQPQQLEAASL
jgi:hypothetical protein